MSSAVIGRRPPIGRLRMPALDFVAGPPRPPRIAWLLLACGLLAATVSGFELLAARERLTAEQDRVEHWQGVAQRMQAPATPPPRKPGASAGTSKGAADAAWGIARHLQHPWAEVFAALDDSTPRGVRWLALDHDTARPELRLEGQAPDPAAALAIVDRLAVQPTFAAAMLTRLDRDDRLRDDGGRARSGVRFEIALRLHPVSRVMP